MDTSEGGVYGIIPCWGPSLDSTHKSPEISPHWRCQLYWHLKVTRWPRKHASLTSSSIFRQHVILFPESRKWNSLIMEISVMNTCYCLHIKQTLNVQEQRLTNWQHKPWDSTGYHWRWKSNSISSARIWKRWRKQWAGKDILKNRAALLNNIVACKY